MTEESICDRRVYFFGGDGGILYFEIGVIGGGWKARGGCIMTGYFHNIMSTGFRLSIMQNASQIDHER